ncbi:hypothetical protein ACFQZE_06645 [Paenibacillus sp. GCM10027627]|uniref:hypothetical protein n=1 Tax=unclassified Paenibacillus TaxID=185978 RepID=UPI00363E5717
MKLLREITCKVKKMKHTCFSHPIKSLQLKVSYLPELISLTNESVEKIENQIKSAKTLSDLTKIDCTEPEFEVDIDSLYTECDLDPRTCNQILDELDLEQYELKRKLNRLIYTIRNYRDVFEAVVSRYKFTCDSLDHHYFNIGYDKENKLICVTYELSDFDPDSISNPTLYLSFGKLHGRNPSRMYLSYNSNGSLIINDFFSIEKNLGHGSFMLNSLLQLVPLLNEKIAQHNLNTFNELGREKFCSWEEYQQKPALYKMPIRVIRGTIRPLEDHKLEDLKRFYNRNGFLKNDRLYKEV